MKRTKLFMIICIIGIFLFVIGHFTYAWVGDNGMTSPIGLTASLHKSYFESGDGGSEYTLDGSGNIVQSETGPFEIKYPIQFYYLAWLQALGYFESDENEDGTIDQYYFYVSADLDMSEFVLPPVGTKDNPFLGHFDGQGHMIYNVNIVSDKASTTDSPETTFSQTEIVGLFGVIGTLGDTANSYTTKSGTTYTYDSSVNEVKDLYISNVNINTKSSNTLIGIAAGYVNGTVSKVGVINSSITFTSSHSALDYTSNLSDYALIGYCTDEFKDNAKVDRIELGKITTGSDTYVEGDDGTGAGGSIAMQSIFNRLQNQENAASRDSSYIISRVEKYDTDGNVIEITNTKPSTAPSKYSSGSSGNSVFMSINENYTYLGGGTRVTKEIYRKTQTGTGFYITDGTNYLTISENSLVNTTDSSLATPWQITANTNGYLYANAKDGNTYYLRYNNSALSITTSTNNRTRWTKTDNRIYYTSGNGNNTINYYLVYDNEWIVTNGTTYTRYAISFSSESGAYLINNGTSLTSTTNINNSYIWDYSGSRQVFTDVDGTRYYLAIEKNSPYNVILQTDAYTWNYTNDKLYVYDRTSSGGWFPTYTYNLYYPYINGSDVRGGHVNYSASTWNGGGSLDTGRIPYQITFSSKDFALNLDLSFIETPIYTYVLESSSNYMDFSNISNCTYVPLKANETGNYTIAESNTGYIVSSNEASNSGDIRVSKYPTENNLGNSKLTPYTVSFRQTTRAMITSNSVATSYGLQKYADSIDDYKTLVSGTNVYGLHFMNSTIATDKYVTIPSATIIGEVYENFQMPANCIDCNLKQNGFINFYAGTYYTGQGGLVNTAFFSFHEIFRDEDMKIVDIKEIKNIYGVISNNQIDTTEEYIYQYTDNSYSGNHTSIPSNYSIIFKMEWLTSPTDFANKEVYYFEIPVNSGEYALGAIEGEYGAYLIYLDLQANKQIVERTIVTETWEETKITNTIPQGIAVVETKGDTVDNLDSVTVQMPASTSGTTTISRSGDAVTYTNSTGANAAYVGEGLTANGNTDGSVAGSVETILTERLTYYDYNTATKVSTTYVTTTVIITASDGTQTRTSTQTINGITNSEYSDDGHTVTLGDTIAKFVYTDKDEATVTVDYGFDYKTSPTTYTITITTDKKIKVKHQLVDSSYTVSINGTTLTTTEAEKEIAATSGD